MSIFGIGVSGMNAAQAGLLTTGHNISNASTPGFNRQAIVQTTNNPQLSGAGFIGQGVTVTTVRRIYSDVLANQVTLAQTQGSQLDAYSAQIQQVANLLGDPSAGLTPTLQDFFSAVANVATNPASMPSRQALLSSASALCASFQDLDQQFAQMRAGINSEITSSVGSINGYAQQIASLNHSIAVVESATAFQPANDLRDQRDALVAALNQEVRASVVKESDGSYDVFVGNGQPVVVGSQAFALTSAASPEDAQRLEIGYQSGASTVLLASNSIQGGKLGGLLSFRTNSLDVAQNGLGRVAVGLAQTFNDQHLLGQDLNGALGTNFFKIAGPAVLPSTTNGGAAAVTATLQDVSALTTSDYLLQYNGAALGNEKFLLTRVSDGSTTALSFPTASGSSSFVVDGVTLKLSTGAALNDSWLIEPTRLGASSVNVALTDPARIAAAAPVRTDAALTNLGSGTISAGSVTSVASLPLPAPVTLTFNSAANQFAVAGAVPPAGPFTYPATVTGGAIPTFGANIAANTFAINGVNVGAVAVGVDAVTQGANVAAAINLITASSGVTATSSAATGAVTLTALGGRQIAITGTLTDTGLTAAATPANTISFNGLSFSISGTPANNDVFTVSRNVNAATDNRNALALGALQTANTLGRNANVAGSQPIASYQSAYSQLVSQVGNTARQMSVTASAQKNVIAQAQQAQQSISGVNLDEEAANLLRYQQAYQAAGKVMQIASTLFQTVLDLGK